MGCSCSDGRVVDGLVTHALGPLAPLCALSRISRCTLLKFCVGLRHWSSFDEILFVENFVLFFPCFFLYWTYFRSKMCRALKASSHVMNELGST